MRKNPTDIAPNLPGQNPGECHCLYCYAEIPVQASKCRYCGEHQHATSPGWGKRLGQAAKYVGYLAAILGLAATLREGYYFVQARQQARNMFRSYLNVAEEFRRLDNLEYARQALDDALKIYPDDVSVATARFTTASTDLLRWAEDRDIDSVRIAEHATIKKLVQNGYRLLQLPHSKAERSEVLTLLGRLHIYDSTWSGVNTIDELFSRASQLTPTSAEPLFWHGRWLLRNNDPEPGLELIRQASELAPGNFFYKAEIGRYLLWEERFSAALLPLRETAVADTEQLDLLQIRAVNEARRNLAKWLLLADQQSSILDDSFFDLSIDERTKIITIALAANPNDPELHYIAARFFNHHRQLPKALQMLKLSLRNEADLRRVSRSDLHKLPLYLKLLTVLNQEPETRARLTEILRQTQH